MTQIDWHHRIDEPELMDGPTDYATFLGCLRDLSRVNRLTLAYRPTLAWLRLLGYRRPLAILDIGSGYGDMLRRIQRWAARRKQQVTLTGIDLNPHSARAATEATPQGGIAWVTANAFDYAKAQPVDVVISSLFTHHLSDNEVVAFLRWMEVTASIGWLVNDLHRHPVPYHFFRAWAQIARWHPFVRHDGPVSIKRSFCRGDWKRLIAAAGLPAEQVAIRWWFPFRYVVSRVKDDA